MAKEGSKIIPIEDIGAVAEQGDRDDELWVINNVTVGGVPYFDMYKSCLQCKARVEPHTERLGKCSKMDCMMMQWYNSFTLRAYLTWRHSYILLMATHKIPDCLLREGKQNGRFHHVLNYNTHVHFHIKWPTSNSHTIPESL